MIPAVLGFLPRRRAVPPAEPPLDGLPSPDRFAFVDGLWPADWAEEGRYPLDRRVFGSAPRVKGEWLPAQHAKPRGRLPPGLSGVRG